MTSSTEEILAKRRRCPNLHAHVKALCLSPEARYRLEFPENFQGGVVDLPNLNRFRGESIPSSKYSLFRVQKMILLREKDLK